MTLEEIDTPACIRRLELLKQMWSEKTGISPETNEA
jgi:hypothetical protein